MKRGIISIETNRIMVTLSSEGTIRMTAEEIASLFYVTTASIERHIKKIFDRQMLFDGKNGKTDPLKTDEGAPWKTVQTVPRKTEEIDHLKTLQIAPPS